ncbi:GntR family transcriptional regulator [Streptomyces sp. NPDC008079]|uniref:GntR family transcriptional regulator n=1 Tax=Streptomyces sp. NPDC008079 TaxID=3364806 RepID=UPI0036EEC56B
MSLLEEGGPIFAQIAAELANQIADGTVGEGERVASSNELAVFYRVNPATAARALTVLSDEDLVEKRRGVGMFVAQGARDRLVRGRRRRFAERYVRPLAVEAARLGIGQDELLGLLRDELASVAVTSQAAGATAPHSAPHSAPSAGTPAATTAGATAPPGTTTATTTTAATVGGDV